MSSTPKSDGGPAFPGHHPSVECKGMTLRDWFAGQALAGMMADHEGKNRIGRAVIDPDKFAPKMAALCYLLADAMLAAREGKQ